MRVPLSIFFQKDWRMFTQYAHSLTVLLCNLINLCAHLVNEIKSFLLVMGSDFIDDVDAFPNPHKPGGTPRKLIRLRSSNYIIGGGLAIVYVSLHGSISLTTAVTGAPWFMVSSLYIAKRALRDREFFAMIISMNYTLVAWCIGFRIILDSEDLPAKLIVGDAAFSMSMLYMQFYVELRGIISWHTNERRLAVVAIEFISRLSWFALVIHNEPTTLFSRSDSVIGVASKLIMTNTAGIIMTFIFRDLDDKSEYNGDRERTRGVTGELAMVVPDYSFAHPVTSLYRRIVGHNSHHLHGETGHNSHRPQDGGTHLQRGDGAAIVLHVMFVFMSIMALLSLYSPVIWVVGLRIALPLIMYIIFPSIPRRTIFYVVAIAEIASYDLSTLTFVWLTMKHFANTHSI